MKTRDAFDNHRKPNSRFITKYENYFGIYDRYISEISTKPVKMIEIGVQHGGSLQMWREVLGSDSAVHGIDIYAACKRYEEEGVKIFIGDQSDHEFLKNVIDEIGPVDFILDDGSHIPHHQIKSFEYLFEHGLKEGGVYLVEDCHTSYWQRYGGGLRKRGSFIEYAKGIVDDINYWHMDKKPARIPWASKLVESIEFYSSVVAFRKKAMTAPPQIDVGDAKLLDLDAPFADTKFGPFVVWAKRNPLLQGLVRRNPALWKIMKRFMK